MSSNRWILFVAGVLGFVALLLASLVVPEFQEQLWQWAAVWLAFVAAALGADTSRRFGGDRPPAELPMVVEVLLPLLRDLFGQLGMAGAPVEPPPEEFGDGEPAAEPPEPEPNWAGAGAPRGRPLELG